jgi:energy-coupling factor transporter ATP-binding protein EcfA2
MEIIFEEDYNIEVTYDYSPMRKNVWGKTTVDKIDDRKRSKLEYEKAKKMGLPSHKRVKLTKAELIEKVKHEYKTLFKKGDKFVSKSGINVLVGDNGCGKSTLIKLLKKQLPIKSLIIDMEKSNPKISKPDPEKGLTYSANEIVTQFMWNAESHGETREGVLLSILTLDFDCLVLDEPEQGLSLKNQKRYFNKLKQTNKDIIIVTHSKIFVEEADEVFDVETMKWVNSKKYLKSVTKID